MNKQDKPLDIHVIDEWLENFFLDPLTSYLDETVFRIDLFETADEYIIEALLPQINKDNISIKLEGKNIRIDVKNKMIQDHKQRIISFPFHVTQHMVKASYDSEILEVFISKQRIQSGANRVISIF